MQIIEPVLQIIDPVMQIKAPFLQTIDPFLAIMDPCMQTLEEVAYSYDLPQLRNYSLGMKMATDLTPIIHYDKGRIRFCAA